MLVERPMHIVLLKWYVHVLTDPFQLRSQFFQLFQLEKLLLCVWIERVMLH